MVLGWCYKLHPVRLQFDHEQAYGHTLSKPLLAEDRCCRAQAYGEETAAQGTPHPGRAEFVSTL